MRLDTRNFVEFKLSTFSKFYLSVFSHIRTEYEDLQWKGLLYVRNLFIFDSTSCSKSKPSLLIFLALFDDKMYMVDKRT